MVFFYFFLITAVDGDPSLVFLHHHHPQSPMIDEVGFVELGDFTGDYFELSSHTTMIARTRGPATVSSLKNRFFNEVKQGSSDCARG